MPEKQPVEKKTHPRVLMVAAFIVLVIGGGIAAFAYFAATSKTIYIEQSLISAPLVDLSPTAPGTLKAVFVSEGQIIPANTVVAQVDTELIKSTAGGLVVTAAKNIGKLVAPNTPVVVTIDPAQLRVVGKIDENKGLTQIQVGDPVSFTVDAFGGKSFVGVVDEIAPTSNQSGIVFNISSQRQTQQFDVKVRFDTAAYPQLKNGMSARMWIYTK